MSNPTPKFFATVIYRDLYGASELRRHTHETTDMGEAISYAEDILRAGYLAIRVSDRRYEFIPVARILGIEVY